jgi:site-specific recombinase XerD
MSCAIPSGRYSLIAERAPSVQRTMGHSRLETTGIYVHLSGETLRAEIETHL